MCDSSRHVDWCRADKPRRWRSLICWSGHMGRCPMLVWQRAVGPLRKDGRERAGGLRRFVLVFPTPASLHSLIEAFARLNCILKPATSQSPQVTIRAHARCGYQHSRQPARGGGQGHRADLLRGPPREAGVEAGRTSEDCSEFRGRCELHWHLKTKNLTTFATSPSAGAG